MSNAQRGAHPVVGSGAVVPITDVDVDIVEADAANAHAGVFGHGLGRRFGNGGGVVDVADRDACKIAGCRKRRAATTTAHIGRAACTATELVPGVEIKAGSLAVFGVGHKAHAVGALE